MQCTTVPMTISNINMEWGVLNLSPDYQRQGGVWSDEKQKLLIDSIFNGYDIPKIYFHDLRRDNLASHYSVVDGKQRLNAIRNFLMDRFPIPRDIQHSGEPPINSTSDDLPGKLFSELPDEWREWFKGRLLQIVLIETEEIEEIEDLFFRLNNGEPLNAAEKRNALGGKMCELIREISQHDFFIQNIPFVNRRYNHYEIAAKFLQIESTEQSTGNPFSDLKKRYLDKLVKDNREMNQEKYNLLKDRVTNVLNKMNSIFTNSDPLLSKQSYPQTYYLFWKKMRARYRVENMGRKAHQFIGSFHVLRQENNSLQPEEDRDPALIEYGRLSMQGTNDSSSLEDRVNILIRYFLVEYPETSPNDTHRQFSHDERLAIWIRAGRNCQECGDSVAFDEMHADHLHRWREGGDTIFSNGRCTHSSCNLARG